MIRGITVTLLELSRSGSEDVWTSVEVPNVLAAPVMEVDSNQAVVYDGHRAIYHLAIPKDDTHTWEGQLVQFFGSTWSVVGIPTKGIDSQIPGPWNKKVTVELYRAAAVGLEGLWRDSVHLITSTVTVDDEGYEETVETTRDVVAIFCAGVDAEQTTEGDKSGMRRSATLEIWAGNYDGETRVSYDGCLYSVASAKNTMRGTVLLKLEEVWR